MDILLSTEALFAVIVGGLYGAGFYMFMRRSIVKIIIGVSLLSHASNLLIFSSAGLVQGRPPIIPPDAETLAPPYADPLPQALVLTAIVIGFGIQAFALALIKRVFDATQTGDLDAAERHSPTGPPLASPATPPPRIHLHLSSPWINLLLVLPLLVPLTTAALCLLAWSRPGDPPSPQHARLRRPLRRHALDLPESPHRRLPRRRARVAGSLPSASRSSPIASPR
jgi:multicomponent Na+:H+ antiporter subunit C